MPFPFSITGQVDVDGVHDVEAAATRLERGLEELRARRVHREGHRIRFRAGPFRLVANTNLLVPITRGRLSIEPFHAGIRVTYRLTFGEILFLATGGVLVVLGPLVLRAPSLAPAQAWGILGAAWLWLYGANVLLAMWRFPRWVRRMFRKGA